MTVVESERAQMLDELQVRAKDLATAKTRYADAIFRAKDMGLSNVSIALCVGRTEAAIRMFVQRKKGRR